MNKFNKWTKEIKQQMIQAQHDPNTKTNVCFNSSFPFTQQSKARRVPEAGKNEILHLHTHFTDELWRMLRDKAQILKRSSWPLVRRQNEQRRAGWIMLITSDALHLSFSKCHQSTWSKSQAIFTLKFADVSNKRKDIYTKSINQSAFSGKHKESISWKFIQTVWQWIMLNAHSRAE